jgi:hypothetical protein
VIVTACPGSPVMTSVLGGQEAGIRLGDPARRLPRRYEGAQLLKLGRPFK